MNKKKILYNIIASFITQIISIIIALLVPRLLIVNYGSEINGLVSSINQIINYFSILEGGVCAAACASLFKPIINNEYNKINEILSSVKKFYFKFGIGITIISIILALVYPVRFIKNGLYFKSIFIILIMCTTSILGYLIYLKYNLVLFVNGKQYITIVSASIGNLIAALIQYALIRWNANILLIVLINPIITLLRLEILKRYTNFKYRYINFNEKPNDDAIKQKWDAIIINVAKMLKVVVPLFYINILFDFKALSVYTIYATIFHVGSSIIQTMGNGLTPIIGNIYARGDKKNILKSYIISNNFIFMFVAVISICFGTLLINFINNIYIGTNTDISYYAPLLCVLFIIDEAVLNFRFAPEMLIKASGKLKETSKSAIIEIILSFLITPIGCWLWGFEGILLGPILANIYRSSYICIYCRMNILNYKKFNDIVKRVIIYTVYICMAIILINKLNINMDNTLQWIVAASIIFVVNSIIVFVINYIFIDRTCFKNIKEFIKDKK